MEDFQWILREIVEGGGEASICRSTFVDGLTDGEIERLFHEARARDYEEITADARATLKTLRPNRRLTSLAVALHHRVTAMCWITAKT